MEVVNDTPFHCKARGLYFSVAYYEINLTIKQEKSYTNPVPSPPSLCRTQSGRIKKRKMYATTNGGLANPYFIPGIVSSDARCQMPQTD